MGSLAQEMQASLPDLLIDSVELAGEGDYCEAYCVNRDWIFLVSKHPEAARSLERAAALLPELAPTLPLAIPRITYFGRLADQGRAFVGYPRIAGTELTAEQFHALPRRAQERVAADLAGFLHQIHSYPLDLARQAGVPTCDYPFCATEDGLTEGPAAGQYQCDLERILRYPLLDQPLRDYCRQIVGRHLDDPDNRDLPMTLLHGEVSQDHVLFDASAGRITGVIDFNGVVISDPVRDMLYLYEDYRLPFVDLFLRHYPTDGDRSRLLARLHFYHEWLTVLRLLWALDHQYPQGIERRLREMRALRDQTMAPLWRTIAGPSS